MLKQRERALEKRSQHSKERENKENLEVNTGGLKKSLRYNHVQSRLRTKDIDLCVRQIQDNIKLRHDKLREQLRQEREEREFRECTHKPVINLK